MNKPVYLSSSILKISKILMYEFWYDYIKPKLYWYNVKLHYMDRDSFIKHIKTEDVYEDIENDVENGIPLNAIPLKELLKKNCTDER